MPRLGTTWLANVAVAEELRCRARQLEPPFSIDSLLAEAGVDAVVVGRDLPDGVDEIVSSTADGATIVYRCCVSINDERLAVAHAIAHLILDVHEGHLRPGLVVDEERELRADSLAIEILAPDRLLRPRIVFWPTGSEDIYSDQLDQIAAHFGVPRAVIDQRIRHLEARANL